MGLVHNLHSAAAFHRIVRATRVRHAVNAAFRFYPLRRRLASGLQYRVRFFESVLVAHLLFSKRSYDFGIDWRNIRTFADLGANVGYFPVLVADESKRRGDLQGVAVEANPSLLEDVEWHLQRNSLDGVKAVCGFVGAEPGQAEKDFFVYTANVASSEFAVEDPAFPSIGDWNKIRVPTLSMEDVWVKTVGETRCDLLKIDIEGSEARFVEHESTFLERVDRIIIEWHDFIVPRTESHARLLDMGFELRFDDHESDRFSNCYYARKGVGA
jgi:FkbM family methyltransferase